MIDGVDIAVPIHSFQVYNWRELENSRIEGLITCTTEGNVLSVAVESNGCVAAIQKSHLEGSDKQEVIVKYAGDEAKV